MNNFTGDSRMFRDIQVNVEMVNDKKEFTFNFPNEDIAIGFILNLLKSKKNLKVEIVSMDDK